MGADLTTKKVGLEMETHGLSENIRHGLDERSVKDKELDRLRRAHARAVSKLSSVKNLNP